MTQPKSLGTKLFDSAHLLTLEALTALEAEDYKQFVISGSNGLEHLSKAVLFKINPTLIADTASSRSAERALLHFAGSTQYSISQIRTVSLEGALSRISAFEVFRSSYEELSELVKARNSYFHLAISPHVEPGLVVVFIQAVDDLVNYLGFSSKWFWSNKFDLSRSLLDESMGQLTALIKSRVQTAREYYLEHFGEILPFGLETNRPPIWTGEELQNCPVCNSFAIFEGTYEFDYEEDWDEDGMAGLYAINGRFISSKMKCLICKLVLNSQEELRIADVPLIYSTEETPESLGWDEEPDEDYLRGR